ncbi:MAG TPA: adenylate kinase [Bryobacteraceae bacterium]|nr:adenylate kinase [Bryobacteraceae bacterium]
MRKPNAVIIFLGPPGAGKGTQAARFSAALSIPAISTGEMLRQTVQSQTDLGKTVESVMASGQLVSDELINQVVAERLRQADCRSGCILDGYPRTASQARFLDTLLTQLELPEPVVINFRLAIEKIVDRLSRRRQCPECGSSYTVKSKVEEARCHRDGAILIRRADDNPSAIRRRLELYRATSSEVIDFYRARNYHEVVAARTPKQIFSELIHLLGTRMPPAAAPLVRRSVQVSALA